MGSTALVKPQQDSGSGRGRGSQPSNIRFLTHIGTRRYESNIIVHVENLETERGILLTRITIHEIRAGKLASKWPTLHLQLCANLKSTSLGRVFSPEFWPKTPKKKVLILNSFLDQLTSKLP